MKQPKQILKSYFETGDKPTEKEFGDLIDSYHHQDSGIIITDVKKNENGDQKISFSDGTAITIESPKSSGAHDNKIRVVDLGIINFGPVVMREDSKQRLLPNKGSFIESMLVNAINNLEPPLIVGEDENIIFEFDISEGMGYPDIALRNGLIEEVEGSTKASL